MYLPRTQIAQLYLDLIRSTHLSSSPVLLLTDLTVDALCATRILASLLKGDFITHTIIPVTGYADLQRAGAELVLPLTRQRGGDGGTVVCLGLGGTVSLESLLGLQNDGEAGEKSAMEDHGVEIWLVDSHRPLNLENVFGTSANAEQEDGAIARRVGVTEGRIAPGYKPGKGGVVVWDDGDLEAELANEKRAYFALQGMPEITEDDLVLDDGEEDEDDDDGHERDEAESIGQKRKRNSSSDVLDSDNDSDGSGRPQRRRRSNSDTYISIPSSPGGNPFSAQLDVDSTPPVLPSSPPVRRELSTKQMRKQMLKMRRKHESTLDRYYDLGASAAEPVSSMLYSLASELGRDDNELLWLAIVGDTATSSSASKASSKSKLIRTILQEEVTRLNPIPAAELQKSQSIDAGMPTTARSSTDTSIRLSPEPRLLLTRHWSLYDSMMHSPYLATRLKMWSEDGRKRLNKLLAKMGISISESMKGYLHMDSELKRTLRQRILRFSEQYNLAGLVPGDNGRNGKEGWGFVKSWGWSGTLSADDVATVVAAILEVGTDLSLFNDIKFDGRRPERTYNARVRNLPTPPHSSDDGMGDEGPASEVPDYVTQRFFRAFDALEPGSAKGLRTLQDSIASAQKLYKAILRLGSALINKKQVRHLRAFRLSIVKEGPDVAMFTHPGALIRLAAWIREAIAVIESEKGRRPGKNQDALVIAALDESRGIYVVVGIGGGNGWNSGGKVRSKAEIKEREDKKKRKAAEKAAQKAQRAQKRAERKRLQRERNAANGLDSDDEEFGESDADTESAASDDSDSDSGDDDEGDSGNNKKKQDFNRFGQSFQEVVEETAARVRIDSFEHSVVEVQKEDLSGFLEALSMKRVVG